VQAAVSPAIVVAALCTSIVQLRSEHRSKIRIVPVTAS
jgi:hypothetical protein